MTFASVCVLSYERPQFLHACLESLRDAGEPFELIVCDDGSTSAEVRPYLTRYLEEGLISQLLLHPPGENQGVGWAIKRCFDVAQGDVLVKVDQDLIFQPGWLTRVREILADPQVGLTGLFAYHHDPVDVAKTGLTGVEPPPGSAHTYHTHICGSAFAVTRETYERFGIESHSDAFAEDWDLMKRISTTELVCALPDEALCVNCGFGIGPSTVVVAEGIVREIHHGPVVLDGTWGE